jgi:anti-sigma B factor antagonist
MTDQVDDHRLLPVAATRAARTTEAFAYVHPPTELNGEHARVPVFDVIAEPMTGRLNMVGELDLAGSQQLRDAITAILAYGSADVVVDLAHLRFIDASGIGLLIGLRNELAENDATLRIVNANTWIRRVFSLCGLSAMLAVSVAS